MSPLIQAQTLLQLLGGSQMERDQKMDLKHQRVLINVTYVERDLINLHILSDTYYLIPQLNLTNAISATGVCKNYEYKIL